MSRAPKNPWGGFGPDDGSHRALRLVEAPDVCPAHPEWFPFRAALGVAALVLGGGVIWGAIVQARPWVKAPVARREAPVIVVHAALLSQEAPRPERVRREVAAPPVPPPRGPVQVRELPRPASPPDVASRDLTAEPFVLSDAWEKAAEPLPDAVDEAEAPRPPAPTRKAVPRDATPKPASSLPRARPDLERVAAQVVRRVPPVYPGNARRAGVEGRVVVQATVAATGRVASVSVASSSGSRVLDSAAISAVKRWAFAPETHRGQAVPSAVRVPIVFQLR